MGDIQKRLDNVRQMVQSQDFLEGKGLSNEVNIRIFCYEPRDEMAVRHFIEQLSTDMTLGCQLRICNLYQIFLGICEGMDILDAIPDMEEEDGHDYLLEQLQSTIGVDEIVQKIQSEPFQPGEVLVLIRYWRHHCLQRCLCWCFIQGHLMTSSCGCSTV